jgi:hypothetical protein
VKRAFIDQDDHQRTLLWTSKRDIDQVFVQEQDPNAVQQTGVFAGKRVLLGVELGINAQTKEALDQWVIMAGGEAVSGETELTSCDVYITRWREGAGYSAVSYRDSEKRRIGARTDRSSSFAFQAIKTGKTVGTLMWFYYVLRVGRLTSPMDELLHYPVPRDGVTGFAGLVSLVTIRCFGGRYRDRPPFHLAENRHHKLHRRLERIPEKAHHRDGRNVDERHGQDRKHASRSSQVSFRSGIHLFTSERDK